MLIFKCSTTILVLLWNFASAQELDNDVFQCDCMEYWDCVGRGGQPFAYCEYTNAAEKVCCFLPPSPSSEGGLIPGRGKVASCGRKGADSGRDEEAEPGEWPWHVAILETPLDLYVCGGSLIDEFWVMTAAHCVDDYPSRGRSLKVRLGEYDVSSESEPLPFEEVPCGRVLLHPAFDNETLENDVALLRLERPAKRRPHVDVVCLPETEGQEAETLATECYITGWGRRTEASNHSFILKEVKVPIWERERCQVALQSQFGDDYALPTTSLCAGAEGRDACDGDGGGPLVCRHKSRWYQVGVISFGIGCGRRDTPGVYTRTRAYVPWIHDTVAEHANQT
ncbi:hypothetical protein JTE90_000345 [Oedothorax gibbosus]|uniref:Peptidase S1 domain-containing protein n=1 Tax=Oedothorax gibbosus TaxID=931172 RepID=A0AAV6U0U5_9ARAC|nr:hypothetical protein JTE90_000345 [Oedothorax gibbosus]